MFPVVSAKTLCRLPCGLLVLNWLLTLFDEEVDFQSVLKPK